MNRVRRRMLRLQAPFRPPGGATAARIAGLNASPAGFSFSSVVTRPCHPRRTPAARMGGNIRQCGLPSPSSISSSRLSRGYAVNAVRSTARHAGEPAAGKIAGPKATSDDDANRKEDGLIRRTNAVTISAAKSHRLNIRYAVTDVHPASLLC